MDVQIFLQTQAGVTPIKNFYLDMFDDETIELNRSIQDVRDISKQFSDYSKSFNVPASAANNEAFKFFFKTDLLDGYNQHQEANAIIEFKGIPLVSGTIELMGATTYKGKEQAYEVVFYGNVKSISQVMGEDTLPQIDWSAYDHTLTFGVVNFSWNGNLFNGGIVYPLWDCSTRGWLYDSNNNQNNANNIALSSGAVQLDELKPAIRLKEFIQSIFSNYGFTLNSTWLDKADTLKMYVQPQREAGVSANPTDTASYNLEATETGISSVTATPKKLPFTTEVYDNGGSFDPTTSIYTAQYVGVHSFNLSAKLTSTTPFFNIALYDIRVKINGASPIYVASIQSILNVQNDASFNLTLDTGDTVEFYIAANVSNSGLLTSNFSDLVLRKTSNTLPRYNNTAKLDFFMPPQKVSEFFSKFLQTFNLILEPTSLGVYTLEPLEDWYSLGTKRYWDEFIDQKELVYSKIPIFKNIDLKHENVENDENKTFTKQVNRTFGQVLWDSDLEGNIDFSDGELKVESPFNVQVPFNLYDNASGNTTQIEYQRFFEEGDPVVSELNLAYFNGIQGCNDFFIQDSPSPAKLNYYPNFSFADSSIPNNNSRSLSYSLEQALNSSIPIETLYQTYYNDYLRRLYSSETRMVVCTAIISLVEFQNLRLNDTIYFQGVNYIINSLVYDFKKQIAKLELITRNENIDVQKIIGIGNGGIISTLLPASKNDVNLYNATNDSGTLYVNQDQGQVSTSTKRGQNETVDPIVWRGEFKEGGYPANSLVVQDGWLAIATTQTTDAPAPVTEGDPYRIINGNFAPTSTASNSVIASGHTYTFTNKTFVSEVLVYPTTVAANWSYRVIIKDLLSGNETILTGLTLIGGQWNTVQIGNNVYAAGTELLIYLETTNSGGSATYAEDFNFWPTYPPPTGISVLPYLEFNGVPQTPEVATAMGVDIKLQDVTFSPDFTILSYSNFFSSGGGGAGAVESVNGQTGVVSLGTGDLNDVTTSTPSDGDIIVYRAASGQYVLEQKPAAGTNPAWGDITGSLSSQTDLQSALDLKVNAGDLADVATSGSYLDLTNTPTTITAQQASDILDNNAKVGITAGQAAEIAANTLKISYTDAAQVATNTSDISTIQSDQIVQDGLIATNTAKVGITPQQSSDITTNNAKVGITTSQANEIAANTLKVGITTAQSNAIVANTSKISYTDAAQVAANTSDISTIQGEQSTQDAAIALNTAKVGITPQQASDIVDNNNKVGITTTQAADITANNVKISYTDGAAVALNTAKRSYPIGDENKLAAIEAGAEVNVKSDWNASSGDAQILNKPTIPAAAPVDSVNAKTGVVTLDTSEIPEAASGLFKFVTNSEKVSITANTIKLSGIEAGAEVNNIPDAQATSLTNGADNALHYHASDRNRTNHTGTQLAATISDFNASVTKVKGVDRVNEIFDEDFFNSANAGENLYYNSATGGQFSLPSNSTEAIDIGTYCHIYQYGTGVLTLAADAGVTIRSKGGLVDTNGQYAYVKVVKIGANEYLLSGDLA